MEIENERLLIQEAEREIEKKRERKGDKTRI
jgi:hypothetical protein